MAKGAASVSDYRALAKARLPHFLFEYLDGGSYDEITLGKNVADLRSVTLRQRVLRDVSSIDLSTELFDTHWSMPVGLGPVGLSGLYARRGEVQAARAATAAGVPFSLSTLSACSIDEVATKTQSPFWFQLYIVKDREFVRDMIARAKQVGCGALLLTVDLAVPGTRYRDYRSGLSGLGGGRAGRARPGARATRLGMGCRRARPADDNGQPRSATGFRSGVIGPHGLGRAQLRCGGHVEGCRVGSFAMGRSADHQGHPRSQRCARGYGERR